MRLCGTDPFTKILAPNGYSISSNALWLRGQIEDEDENEDEDERDSVF